MAARAAYSPCERPPGEYWPSLREFVSASKSKDRATATFAPSGQDAGVRSFPARTAETMDRTWLGGISHGFGGWVSCPDKIKTLAKKKKNIGTRAESLFIFNLLSSAKLSLQGRPITVM
jgi:hypothetical protein